MKGTERRADATGALRHKARDVAQQQNPDRAVEWQVERNPKVAQPQNHAGHRARQSHQEAKSRRPPTVHPLGSVGEQKVESSTDKGTARRKECRVEQRPCYLVVFQDESEVLQRHELRLPKIRKLADEEVGARRPQSQSRQRDSDDDQDVHDNRGDAGAAPPAELDDAGAEALPRH